MFKLLRNAVVALMIAGGGIGLLAMSSSSISAFQSCVETMNCFRDKDCEDKGVCDSCQGGAFPVAGDCRDMAVE